MSHFGQPPLAALNPLFRSQNLKDLADVTEARTNLNVFSKEESLLNGVPIGTIIPFWGQVAPPGFLPCYGQTIGIATFPDLVQFINPGQTYATLPDLRGEFLRGWDAGRNVDSGRTFGSTQRGTVTVGDPSNISYSLATYIGASDYNSATFSPEAGYDVVPESYFPNVKRLAMPSTSNPGPLAADGYSFGVSRPRNVAVLYCIKAYGSVVNSGTANLGSVLSELSSTVKQGDFGKYLGANGYQKLPGGLIIQWGSSATWINSSSYQMDTLFPIAFPNSCVSVTASIGINSADYDTDVSYRTSRQDVSVSNPTLTGFKAQVVALDNLANSRRFQWIAIGY